MNIFMQLFVDISKYGVESFLMAESAWFDWRSAQPWFHFSKELSYFSSFWIAWARLGFWPHQLYVRQDAESCFGYYHFIIRRSGSLLSLSSHDDMSFYPAVSAAANRLNEDSWTIFVRGIKLPPAASAVVQLRTYFQNYVFVTVIQ